MSSNVDRYTPAKSNWWPQRDSHVTICFVACSQLQLSAEDYRSPVRAYVTV